MPETSIIIRAYNEEQYLPGLLDGIGAQTYRDFETIVVDSGSSDRTREIAQRRADLLLQIAPEDFTFGYSLNVGIRESKGRIIAIVSAHTAPVGEHWLERLIEPLRDPKNAMVYGRQRGHTLSKFGELLDLERVFGAEPKVLEPPNYFANNANSAVRRDLWELHPFDETLPGLEDAEWAKYWMEKAHQVIYEPEATIHHIHRESWPQVRNRYFREALAASSIGARRRRDLPAEVLRETRYLAGDLVAAGRQHILRDTVGEVVRFRFEKLAGTTRGLWNGNGMSSPLKRNSLYYDKQTYKAVVVRGPGQASIEDVVLRPLAPTELLVRVSYQAVGSADLGVYHGSTRFMRTRSVHYPIVPGNEFSGTVATVGAKITDFREGDRVVVQSIQACGRCAYCAKGEDAHCEKRQEVGVTDRDGGYAEYAVAPGRFVHRIPDKLSLLEATLCQPIATVLKGLRRLEGLVKSDDDSHQYAVIGAGHLGHLAAHVLALSGNHVTVFDQSAKRLDSFAGTSVRTGTQFADLKEFGVIVETTGNAETLQFTLHLSAANSVILLLEPSYEENSLDLHYVVGQDRAIIGSTGGDFEDYERALRELQDLDVKPLLEEVLPMGDYERAWKMAENSDHLRVSLRVNPPEAA